MNSIRKRLIMVGNVKPASSAAVARPGVVQCDAMALRSRQAERRSRVEHKRDPLRHSDPVRTH